MKVLVTGASGYLGSYILSTFKVLNYEVDTIGRSKTNTIEQDLSTSIKQITTNYDLIVHAAGKAHIIPKTKEECDAFYSVNLQGTKNLLRGLKRTPRAFVFISTVSVYGLNTGEQIDEDQPLKAIEPYGKSKIFAEEEITKWGKNNNVTITILRLPLIVGYNPPGNLKAMIYAIRKGYYFNIGKANARKSMVFAEDVAAFIPTIKSLGGIYNLTDGYHPSFKELAQVISNYHKKRKTITLNYYLVLFLSNFGTLFQWLSGIEAPINRRKFNKITKSLTFQDSKAISKGWNPEEILQNKNKWLKK